MIHIVRVIFLLLVAIVASVFIYSTLNSATPTQVKLPGPTTGTAPKSTIESPPFDVTPYLIISGVVVVTFAVITIDLLYKKKDLTALSGLLFGIFVGVLISICLGYLLDQVAAIFLFDPSYIDNPGDSTHTVLRGIKVLLGLMVTYLTTTFVLQTKDDFRFIIPYVEFQRATKGPRPIILDTSVIIDGRIADVASTGIFESTIIVPRFVLNELQTVADSGDRLKRSRGRRGLDVLEKLKALPRIELRFWDGLLTQNTPDEGVDQKLVALAQQEGGRIVTNDYNLNKVATLRGVQVVNINLIADALKPVVLPGETMKVRISKPGENAGQGVGYLEDGTMVVVENTRDKVGAEVDVVVTNVIQKPQGKMIFGRLAV
jgi:uncharacterized protein YacL